MKEGVLVTLIPHDYTINWLAEYEGIEKEKIKMTSANRRMEVGHLRNNLLGTSWITCFDSLQWNSWDIVSELDDEELLDTIEARVMEWSEMHPYIFAVYQNEDRDTWLFMRGRKRGFGDPTVNRVKIEAGNIL